ncbi:MULTISPECIES: HAD family hydrolase [unclassified Aureispira]|uniref:KdsC family phosphatase n=1 Tax=unclassified Aureispira TaxID=2649989 RepID=UPI0006990011|nr:MULTISPECIES: HAD hydrolase family protein [unclassified Aureispira]WMX16762.1 HAD hydrolase family protein [Aureispira sp. CCB-E]
MSFLDKLHDIDTIILDVDGVLTDSSVYIFEDGVLMRKMNVRDGYAIKYAISKGYRLIIITGGKSEGVIKRLQNLGVQEIYSGMQDKLEAMDELIEIYGLDLSSTVYMGDDLPDYEPLRLVHLPTCPANAAPEIREICQYISPFKGGEGCVRDLIEKILKVQGKWIETDVVNLTKDKPSEF